MHRVKFTSQQTGRSIVLGYRTAEAASRAVDHARSLPAAQTDAEYLGAE